MIMELTDEMNMKICKNYAMQNKFKKPIYITGLVATWEKGNVYGVRCGIFDPHRYLFFMSEGEVDHVVEM